MSIFSKTYQPFNLLTAELLKQKSTLPSHVIDAMNINTNIFSGCLVWVAFVDSEGRDAVLSINHPRNRKMNKKNRIAIAADALRDRFNWQLGFAVFQDGKLVDAQTRWGALGDANETSGALYPILCIEVPAGEDILAILGINQRARSASDSDNYLGFDWPRPVADAFATINEFLNGGANGHDSTPVVREALRPFFAEPLIKVYNVSKTAGYKSTTWLGFLATTYKTYPVEILTFLKKVVNNEDCARGTKTYKVRDFIGRTKFTSTDKWPSACTMFNAFEAWRKYGNEGKYSLSSDPSAYKAYLRGIVIEEGIPVISLSKDTPEEICEKLSTISPEELTPEHYAHLHQPNVK